jgi:hypothetical protein
MAYQFLLTNAASGRKEPARILAQLMGENADVAQIDATLTRLIGHAAERLRAPEEDDGPTLREIVAEKVPAAWLLRCRTARGLWSEAGGGREVGRAEFVTHTPEWLLEAAAKARDAPKSLDGTPIRPDLKRAIVVELEILWSNLVSTLPTEADVDLGTETEKAAAFRRATVRLWKRTQTFEVVKGHESKIGEVAARASLASRVQTQARDYLKRLVSPPPRERWREVQRAFDAWWRPWVDADGEVHILLAMRYTLTDQAGVELPGVRDQTSLTALGKGFGVLQDPPPGVPAVLSGGPGQARLGVLSLELARELLSEPLEDPEDNPREPGAEG